jgi:hypothetical protein
MNGNIRFRENAQTVLDAKAATGIGTPIDVSNYRHIILAVSTESSANLTVKFQGSGLGTAPTFSAAQSTANHWDYVQVKDLEDASTLDGDVGLALTGTDDVRLFEVNTNGLRWFCANVTARSAGSVTVKAALFRD